MSYKSFEHQGVEYKLFLATHSRSSYPMIKNSGGLKDLDALVLESENGDLDLMMHYAQEDPQYVEIFSRIPEENPNIVIYGAGFPISALGVAGNFAEVILSSATVCYGASAFGKGEEL